MIVPISAFGQGSLPISLWSEVKDCDSIDTSKDPVSFMGLVGTVLTNQMTENPQEINVTQMMDNSMPNLKARLECVGATIALSLVNEYQIGLHYTNWRSGVADLLATLTINAVMGSVTQYHCEKCNMEFPSLAELNYHQISKHSNIPD